jgi:3-hydroxyisobutyrate dehydrogenase
MGLAMASRLHAAGLPVVGTDIRAEAIAKLAASGAATAPTAATAAANADALVLMTVTIDQAEAVLFEAGAAAALSPASIIALMATCAPARVTALAGRLAALGHHLIDAPVSGGVVGAEAGTLTIMAAAPKPIFAHAEPWLRVMGSNLHHLGERPGQGAAMKIVNQLLCGVHIAVAAEGLAFAERQGIDPALALEILSASAASSWMLKNRGPRMVSDDPTVASAVDIFVKDMGLVLDAGRSAKMGLPFAALAHQAFLSASGLGLGAADDSEVIETYRALDPSR